MPLTAVFVAANLEIGLVSENTTSWWGIVLVLAISALLGFFFARILLVFNAFMRWGVNGFRSLREGLFAADRQGFIGRWLLELVLKRQVKYQLLGALVLGIGAFCDPVNGYRQALLWWLAALAAILWLTVDKNLVSALAAALVCGFCSVPFTSLMECMSTGRDSNLQQVVTAALCGCLTTGMAWWCAVGDGTATQKDDDGEEV